MSINEAASWVLYLNKLEEQCVRECVCRSGERQPEKVLPI